MPKRNVILAVLVAFMMVMALMPADVAVADEDCERYGQGYWRQWLAEQDEEWECESEFTAEELLGFLNTPARGNATQILLYQFIAASLNVSENECVPPPGVLAALTAAGEHLEKYLEDPDLTTASREEILHWKDILEFWNENEQAVLLSVWYEGICDEFGHVGDVMTFTFSNDVYQDGNIMVHPTNLKSEWTVMDWLVAGNVVTATVNDRFNNLRSLDEAVESITGLFDFIGVPVVVPAGGVEIDYEPYVYTVLESVVYEGTCSEYGLQGDVLTLTFSDYIQKVDDIVIQPLNLQSQWDVMDWVIDDNILTVTVTTDSFTNLRSLEQPVASITGLADLNGCLVVVPDDGVEIQLPQTVVESVVFSDVDGTGHFGTSVGDEIVITFSRSITKVDDITATFPGDHPDFIISHGEKTDYALVDNVLTLTVNAEFTNARTDMFDRSLTSITGLEDCFGNAVVVPDGGVQVTAP